MVIDRKVENCMFWRFIGHRQVSSLGYIGENLMMANKAPKHVVY